MKKVGNFENLMSEVYKSLYEKKNKNESKLSTFTKEVLLKIKKNNTNSTVTEPEKAKYALMFNPLRDKGNTKMVNNSVYDKMNKIYSETILKRNTKTKSEISNFFSTARMFSSPHITSSNTNTSANTSINNSKFSSPIKAKMSRVKNELDSDSKDDRNKTIYTYKKKQNSGKMSKCMSTGHINFEGINNVHNSKSLRTSLDCFRVELEHFLKKDISIGPIAPYYTKKQKKAERVKTPMNLRVLNSSQINSSPKMDSENNNVSSRYRNFMSFLPKDHLHRNFFKVGDKERNNMSLKMNSFRTRMELQNL